VTTAHAQHTCVHSDGGAGGRGAARRACEWGAAGHPVQPERGRVRRVHGCAQHARPRAVWAQVRVRGMLGTDPRARPLPHVPRGGRMDVRGLRVEQSARVVRSDGHGVHATDAPLYLGGSRAPSYLLTPGKRSLVFCLPRGSGSAYRRRQIENTPPQAPHGIRF